MSDAQASERASSGHRPFGPLRAAAVVLCALTLVGLLVWRLRPQPVRLPEISEIEEMKGTFYFQPGHGFLSAHPEPVTPFITFKVPPADWSRIVAVLRPAGAESHPEKRQGMGQIHILHKNGRRTEVELYYTERGEGAYSLSSGSAAGGAQHFRAGKTADIEKALEDAYRDRKH